MFRNYHKGNKERRIDSMLILALGWQFARFSGPVRSNQRGSNMQAAMLNRATTRVADRTEVIGRVTTGSVKHGFCAKKQSDLSRICVLAIFGSVVLLAPVPARAQAPPSIPAEIAALQKQVAALQTQVSAQQAQITSLQNQLTAAKPVLALAPFVSVDSGAENGVAGPNIKFTGANIHILSGSGATDDNLSHGGTLTGLGNLIIGYDEPQNGFFRPGSRSGSHNLVIGRFNSFTSLAFGGLVAGEINTISAEAASVSGGILNSASGAGASVSGGQQNTASGVFASVSGGTQNTASANEASVSGGLLNTASGHWSSVSGGEENTASGFLASVSGGHFNTASGVEASVSGGDENTASGLETSVIGGVGNTARGFDASVIGGVNNTANTNSSIRPQPPFP
jgi:hypothetical protein